MQLPDFLLYLQQWFGKWFEVIAFKIGKGRFNTMERIEDLV